MKSLLSEVHFSESIRSRDMFFSDAMHKVELQKKSCFRGGRYRWKVFPMKINGVQKLHAVPTRLDPNLNYY